jgi:peptide-N4-(N-acetyl-beta-glucosaminyl)asparagine amidase
MNLTIVNGVQEHHIFVDHSELDLVSCQIYSLSDILPEEQVLLVNGQEIEPRLLRDGMRVHVMKLQQLQAQQSQYRHILNAEQKQMQNRIQQYMAASRKYELKDWLDKALSILPVEQLEKQADESWTQFQVGKASSSLPPNLSRLDPSMSSREFLVIELAKWFKHDFFTWVNKPLCELCGSQTKAMGMAQATPEESRKGAGRVEIYSCLGVPKEGGHGGHGHGGHGAPGNTIQPMFPCGTITRFPRYNDALTLCDTRRGRCGEQAQLFHL